jgi:hypothetical protein
MMNRIELVPITEISRRAGVCALTAKRRLARAGIVADAVLRQGARPACDLFDASRLETLQRTITTAPSVIA